jgi:mannose-6-phosphate isomerase-like protein (cupin superfamily)
LEAKDHGTPILPSEHAVYDAAKMGKATRFHSPRLLMGLNASEPGQDHALHAHAGMDKVDYVVEGRRLFLLNNREEAMEAGLLLVAPAGVPHRIRNTGRGRLLVLALEAPAPLHGGASLGEPRL